MNSKTLYLECYSGISGDMVVAALIDLGASEEGLRKVLDSVTVDGFAIRIGQTKKCGIVSCDFDVIVEEEPHIHRHLSDVNQIIDEMDAAEAVKLLAKKIFLIVAEAEAKAHSIPIEAVHFHEVGAIDSIVDIISVAFCIDDLGIESVILSELYEGKGHVRCQHGVLPVPVPAVLNIVERYELPLHITENRGEMVTPTGAAIAAALCTGDELPEHYRVLRTGIGAGKKDFPHANILRAMLIEEPITQKEDIWVLESNIDDCSGEVLGYMSEKLFQAGARDVAYIPLYMKKCRPAYLLSVLAERADIPQLEELIFLHSTTIGIRKYPVERRMLERRTETVSTKFGEVCIKGVKRPQGWCYTPEYESVKEICDKTGQSFLQVYEAVMLDIPKNKD